MKIFSCCKSNTYKHAQKKTPAKALILSENFGGFRGFPQKNERHTGSRTSDNWAMPSPQLPSLTM